ncbi:unnamed protein product [Symbiodinium sp. CCMP2592]|nr:unnamed protein product [Symbiodinium sp. CCMP2592]
MHKKVVCPEVQTSQCPRCLTVFSNISSAKHHFRASRDRPCAVDRSTGNLGTAPLQPARHVDRQRFRGRAHAADPAEQESPNGGSRKNLVRMMENLDYRLRQLEGATACMLCFFLPLEGCGLAQAMQAAAAYYDGRSPRKGKPHPDKHRKTTLAGALVKFAAEHELQRFSSEEQAALARTSKLLAAAHRPSLVERHGMIKLMFPPHGDADSYGARCHRSQLVDSQKGHQVRADCPVPAARGLGSGDAVHRVRDSCDGKDAFVGRAAEVSPSEVLVNAVVQLVALCV